MTHSHTGCSVFLVKGHQVPHLFSGFLCPLPSALSFRLSRYAASSCCFSLECSYVFLVSITLKVSLVSLGLYVHFSPYHLSPLRFFVFICPIPRLFLYLYICLTVLLSLQKTAATNWSSNALPARRMINDGYATVINPLNGFSSLSRFFLKALSFFASFWDICKITPITTKRDLTPFCTDVQGVMNVIFKGEVRSHSPT